jgi:hypothetical protein
MKRHLIDLHIHSSFSDGKLSVAEIVDLYGSKGYSAIAITDHLADSKTLTGFVTRKLKLSLSEQNMDYYLETLRQEKIRALEQYNMLLIPGVEITLNSWSRSQGAHIVFLNVDRFIDPNQEIESLLAQNKNFFSIAAHPLWEKSFEFKTTYLWENRQRFEKYFDAWECATAHHFSQQVFMSGYPVLASSDFHGPAQFESWKSQVYCDELSIEALFEMIKNRQVEPVWA